MNIEIIKKSEATLLGKNVIYYNEIDSTQDEAKKLLKGKIQNGTIVLADNQTKGRGTKENIWYTGKSNNIAMTLVLFPTCTIDKLEGLTKLIAQSIVDTIKILYGYELNIKEPNDVFLKDKKIAGILTQSSTSNRKVNYILIGIGFNVNEEEFDENTVNIATSLKKEYNKNFLREEIISKFLEILEKNINYMF